MTWRHQGYVLLGLSALLFVAGVSLPGWAGGFVSGTMLATFATTGWLLIFGPRDQARR